MMTLRRFCGSTPDVPMSATWLLTDLGEARGKQELFARQSPQRLKSLREHAIIESAISSNRIEGVEIAAARVQAVFRSRAALRDRNEEEVGGYRDALRWIHESGQELTVSERTIRKLHRLSRGRAADAGQYKKKDVDIIETAADGRVRVRFATVPAKATRAAAGELTSLWQEALASRRLHPLLALAAFNLDFLCIHPFRDGNGRVSRLLLLLQCYHLGFELGRYISLERIIEQNKERYYETLEESSRGWHNGRHDPWPYINYVLFVLRSGYREFEARAGSLQAPRGDKSAAIVAAVRRAKGAFNIASLARDCPGVSLDLIRHVLKHLKRKGQVVCLGLGRNALWKRLGTR